MPEANLPARLNLPSRGSIHSAQAHIVPKLMQAGWGESWKCLQSRISFLFRFNLISSDRFWGFWIRIHYLKKYIFIIYFGYHYNRSLYNDFINPSQHFILSTIHYTMLYEKYTNHQKYSPAKKHCELFGSEDILWPLRVLSEFPNTPPKYTNS